MRSRWYAQVGESTQWLHLTKYSWPQIWTKCLYQYGSAVRELVRQLSPGSSGRNVNVAEQECADGGGTIHSASPVMRSVSNSSSNMATPAATRVQHVYSATLAAPPVPPTVDTAQPPPSLGRDSSGSSSEGAATMTPRHSRVYTSTRSAGAPALRNAQPPGFSGSVTALLASSRAYDYTRRKGGGGGVPHTYSAAAWARPAGDSAVGASGDDGGVTSSSSSRRYDAAMRGTELTGVRRRFQRVLANDDYSYAAVVRMHTRFARRASVSHSITAAEEHTAEAATDLYEPTPSSATGSGAATLPPVAAVPASPQASTDVMASLSAKEMRAEATRAVKLVNLISVVRRALHACGVRFQGNADSWLDGPDGVHAATLVEGGGVHLEPHVRAHSQCADLRGCVTHPFYPPTDAPHFGAANSSRRRLPAPSTQHCRPTRQARGVLQCAVLLSAGSHVQT